ncbi:MAG: sulfonate ABC transporter substrate-binding protein [Isosphaeraceae bacterium]|nr:sulfonate ABC transporter substrate-binding protein [Isosphaeraceae bacterium]
MSRRWSGGGAGLAALGLAAVLDLVGCGTNGGDRAGGVVRIGYQKAGTLNLLRLRGRLTPVVAKLGVVVEWVGFPAGPQLLEALNVGSIDYGHTGDAPPILAQAAGVPFVYVGYEPSRPHAEAILVPAGSPLRSVADLKGRRVALNKGSNVQYLLVRALEQAGVPYDQVRAVFLPPSDARAAFEGGSVDAWAAWDPYLAEAEIGAGARVLTDGEGLVANREFHLASRALVQDRPDVVRAILDAVGQEGAWAQANADEVAHLLGAEIGLGAETMQRVIGRKSYAVAPMDETVVAEQQRVADTFAALGLIPAKIVVRDAVPASPPVVAGGIAR